jgi:hypothetical protein
MTGGLRASLGRQARSPHAIVRYEPNHLEFLRVSSKVGEEALPVFSSEEMARRFLLSGAFDEGWRVRWCSTGEMISLLLGLCADVESVLLDPPTREDAWINPMYRECFVTSLAENRSVGWLSPEQARKV